MFKLTYSSQNFPASLGPLLQGTNTLQTDWPELVWAALSVGKAEIRHLSRYGKFSWYELLMRLYMLRVNLRESKGELVQTEVYKTLDPSEKNAISYFMGLTMAKLLANRFLDVPWLIHLDSFDVTRLTFGSKKRPDLLGHNRSKQWLIMEAKGRSGKVEKGLMPKALIQTQAVDTVDRYSPFMRVASASFIKTKKSGVLAAQWECSVGSASEPGVKLKLDSRAFLNRYYELFRNLLDSNSPEDGTTTGVGLGTLGFLITSAQTSKDTPVGDRALVFRIADFPEFDIRIGLLDRSNEFLLENKAWYNALFSNENDNAIRGFFAPDTFIAPDGILIRLGPSWNSENMGKEPNERLSATPTA